MELNKKDIELMLLTLELMKIDENIYDYLSDNQLERLNKTLAYFEEINSNDIHKDEKARIENQFADIFKEILKNK